MMPQISRAQLVAAFTEWEREFREKPDEFLSGSERYGQSEEECGESNADYLLALVRGAK